jgi:hypothetical protein
MAGRKRIGYWIAYTMFCAAMVAWGYLYFTHIPVFRGKYGEWHWTYSGQFHKAIKDADRIVVWDFSGGLEEKKILEVTDPQEI